MTNHGFVVLVGFDERPQSEEALRAAFQQASEHPLSHVHVVRILSDTSGAVIPGIDSPRMSWGALVEQAAHEASLLLEKRVNVLFAEWAKDHRSKIDSIEVHTRFANPVVGILNLADELNADLVVVGSHEHGRLHRLLFGSTAERITRQTDRQVLVVHHRDDPAALIEPPCPDCVQVRFETNGAEIWCQRHREHHTMGRARHHSSRPMQ